MRNPDLLYLYGSASIIEQSMSGVSAILMDGNRSSSPGIRRGACQTALQIAITARNRLDALIAEMGGRSENHD